MACVSQAMMVSGNTCSTFAAAKLFSRKFQYGNCKSKQYSSFRVRASSDESDRNTEECSPEKEVGKVSMEWMAGDKTKVVGTFPPRKRGWTGYVEKDTAGQTNVYSVEPAVYVAESAISSGTAGSSSDGAENTAAIAAGLALISIAAASSILLQVGKNGPQVQPVEYNGPALSYYISKFQPPEIVKSPEPTQTEASLPSQADSTAPEVSQTPTDSDNQSAGSSPIADNAS